MRSLFNIFIMLLFSLNAFSQEFSETTVDDDLFLCFDMHPEQKGYKYVKVLFSRKKARKFLKKMKRYIETTDQWTQKAFENNVSKYRKPIHGSIKFSHLEFYYDRSYSTSQGYFMVPSFDVDDQGDCFLLLRGYYKGRNVTPYIVSFREGDKIRYQQLSEFNYYIRIPSKELQSFYRKLESAVNKFEYDVKNYKHRKDLFK